MDMAKHIHNYFCDKINKLRGDMEQTGNIKAEVLIRNSIMQEKNCNYQFGNVTMQKVEELLLECKGKKKTSGVDNIDSKFKFVASLIAVPITHIWA